MTAMVLAGLMARGVAGPGFDRLVPVPASITPAAGACTIASDRGVSGPPLADTAMHWLNAPRGAAGGVVFTTDGAPSTLGEEGYLLELRPEQITIRATHAAGFFYGAVTLSQLGFGTDGPLPCGRIEDRPRFAWRGFMLDTARRYYPVGWIQRLIELLALHKLNVLHLHLTDDEGWRLASDAYPKLTSVGAERGPGTALPHSLIPGVKRSDRGQVHRGHYTRHDIAQILATARAHHVTVIPEIDVPGHAKAAVTAYPGLLQDPADPGSYQSLQHVPHNTMDPGLPTTYTFVDTVFGEVAALFPDAPYLHVGGDEVPGGAWKGSPSARALAASLGLDDVRDVQGVFLQRVEKMLEGHGRRLLGWQEIATAPGPKVSPAATIIAWSNVSAALEVARQRKLAVILAPAQVTYFDARYTPSDQEPGQLWAGSTDTAEVYAYQPPVPDDVEVLGLHACLWSETVPDPDRADYMIWPRAAAFAEVAWSPHAGRQWTEFEPRLRRHLPRLEARGVRYRRW